MTVEPALPMETPTGSQLPYSPPEQVRWGIWDAIVGLLLFFAVLFSASVLVLLSGLTEQDSAAIDALGFAAAVFGYGTLAGVVVYASKKKGLGRLAEDFGLRFKPVDLAIGFGIGFAVKLFSVVLGAVAILIAGDAPPTGNFVLSDSTLWIVLNGILVASILGPVVEELFFRGLILRAVRNFVLRLGRRQQPAGPDVQRRAVLIAILVSSAAFTLLHLYQSTDIVLLVILGGSTLALGIANALVAIQTGRLGAPIIAHILFNGSAVLTAIAVS